MTESDVPPKPAMAPWAKIGVAVGIVFLVVIVGICVASVFLVNEIKKDSPDPAKIRSLLNTMATVDDPLPTGFVYDKQLDLLGVKMVALRHEPDQLHLILTTRPWTKDTESLEKSINETTSSPNIKSILPKTAEFKADKKGTEDIGGKKFTYALGRMRTQEGEEYPSLLGVFTPGDGQHVTMLIGIEALAANKKGEATARPYNMTATEQFLHAIKKI